MPLGCYRSRNGTTMNTTVTSVSTALKQLATVWMEQREGISGFCNLPHAQRTEHDNCQNSSDDVRDRRGSKNCAVLRDRRALGGGHRIDARRWGGVVSCVSATSPSGAGPLRERRYRRVGRPDAGLPAGLGSSQAGNRTTGLSTS